MTDDSANQTPPSRGITTPFGWVFSNGRFHADPNAQKELRELFGIPAAGDSGKPIWKNEQGKPFRKPYGWVFIDGRFYPDPLAQQELSQRFGIPPAKRRAYSPEIARHLPS